MCQSFNIFFERDPAQWNVYHAAGNAQEQQREQIHGRDADFAERPRKKTKLDEPESHQKQKYEYEHKKSEKRGEKHLTILSYEVAIIMALKLPPWLKCPEGT